MPAIRHLRWRTEGQDLIEYGVLVALIAASVIATATGLGVKVPGFYTTAADALPGGDAGNDNPGNDNPRNGNPGNGNPNPAGGNPGGGNPGGGNPGGGKGK